MGDPHRGRVACYNQLEKAKHLKGFQPRIHFLITRRGPEKNRPESLPRVQHRCWQEYIWPKGGYIPSFPALFFLLYSMAPSKWASSCATSEAVVDVDPSESILEVPGDAGGVTEVPGDAGGVTTFSID